jgi:hypothetical protein
MVGDPGGATFEISGALRQAGCQSGPDQRPSTTHGDDYQLVPIGDAGLMSVKILRDATHQGLPGFRHEMPAINADQINADLLAFIKS